MNYGFVRVGAAVPEIKVADCVYNANKIIGLIKQAQDNNIQFVVFPELCLTAYTCADLFYQRVLIEEAKEQMIEILKKTKGYDVVSIIGMPVFKDNQLFNCAVVIQKGLILGVVPKTYLPGSGEFYEERWFSPSFIAQSDTVSIAGHEVPFGTDLLFENKDNSEVCFGIELCEDLWAPIPPTSLQAMAGAIIHFNLSASNELIGKCEYRKSLIKQQSARCISGYVYSSAGKGESTTDLVYGGHALISEYGKIIEESERFSDQDVLIYSEIDIEKLLSDRQKSNTFMESKTKSNFRRINFSQKKVFFERLKRKINPHPFVPGRDKDINKRCAEIFQIQTCALAKRIEYSKAQTAIIGVSGGMDSTLALLATVKAFDMLKKPRKSIFAFTMPGFGTSDVTYENSIKVIEATGVTKKEVDIKSACTQHFNDIKHDINIHDVTFENVQARERTQVLMDYANKVNGLVIGTGDLSEIALGWSTYNGDHMSMYAVNCSIPKTLVKFLIKWLADNDFDEGTKESLYDILNTPISPELLPNNDGEKITQKTEDIIGPYELHDFFLYHMIRCCESPEKILFLCNQAFNKKYSTETIKKWLAVFYKRFFSQQFKRSCIPDGPKVGTVSLSPRGDWKMPSDAEAEIWINRINNK